MEGEELTSEQLYYEFVSIEEGNDTPLIWSSFAKTEVKQHETFAVEYNVYDPLNLEASVSFTVNGTALPAKTVTRETQTFTYRADTTDNLTIVIACGSASKTIALTVTASDVSFEAVTDQLALYLNATGRSNNDNNRSVWTYGEGVNQVSVALTGFNWTRDGWLLDDSGMNFLRTMGGSQAVIPFTPFADEFFDTGKTIEIEFKSHNVLDYETPIISCMSEDRGFVIYADHAVFKSARSEVINRFTTDRRMRLTFSIQPRNNSERLIYVYIDGEHQGATPYSASDAFKQTTPVGITIGGNAQCGADIYNIRIYNRYLTPDEVLMNYIADRPIVQEMIDLFEANDVFDANGKVVYSKLPGWLPYVIFTGPESPQYKGDKKIILFDYYEPANDARRLTADGVQIDVQGTSSQYYAVKNYKIKLKNGATMNGRLVMGFYIRDGEIVVTEFTLKADVASSESANNIVIAKLYNDLSKKLSIMTPPQIANSAVRQGVDGFQCVVFWDYGDGPEFVGKYNFNNDKGTFDTFGFSEGDEVWDVRSNTSQLSKFHTDVFPENWATEDYESIYPEDYTDAAKMRPMTEFLCSTWQGGATNSALPSPVTYEGVQYTHDTAAYRLAKFKDGYANFYDLDNAAFYYCFTLGLLMVDSRQKNEHLAYWHQTQKWWELIWDCDTALGTDNRGALSFEYWMEDTDIVDGENVFNGADNVKWENFRQAFWTECADMWQRMRSSGMFNAAYLKKLFKDWQSAWPKAIWNADTDFKHIAPLRNDGDATYIPMAQGSKEWQRDEFIDWRIPYIDSMFDRADALQSIMFRPYYQVTEEERTNGDVDIDIDVYKKSYVTVVFDSTKVSHRHLNESQSCHIENPLSYANDAVCAIHNAIMVKAVHGLPKLKVGYWDGTKAVNMQSLELGSQEAGYINESTKTVNVGANEKMQLVELSNCVNFGTGTQKTLSLAECPNIQKVYTGNTKILGIDLPNGGALEELTLPSTVTSIVLRNQPKLTDAKLTVQGYTNVEQLWLENMSGIDNLAMLNRVPANTAVRITGIDWTCSTVAEIDTILNLLDTMRGIDIDGQGHGIEVDNAQISGTIHIDTASGSDMARFAAHGYQYLHIDAAHTTALLTYKTWDGSSTIGSPETIVDGVNGTRVNSTARTQTDEYTFSPNGWSLTPDGNPDANALNAVVADRTVYAAYTRTKRKYTATFVKAAADGGGTLYTQTEVEYGTTPTYSGATPAKANVDASEYPFEGWTPALGPITGNTTYTAVFGAPTPWTVTYNQDNGTTIATETVLNGHDGTYNTTPTKASTAQYSYTFSGWATSQNGSVNANAQKNITADRTLWAVYTSSVRTYTATFVRGASDGNDTLYTQNNVPYGTTPTYSGNTPVKSGDTNGDYPFEGWYPALGPISANTTYTAVFGSPKEVKELTDSWATIFAALDNGTFDASYKIGNYKSFDLGTEGSGTLSFVAKNADPLANGLGNAPVSCVVNFALNTKHRMNPSKTANTEGTGTLGGWDKSEMKSYLLSTIWPKIPQEVRDRIVPVTKYTRIYQASDETAVNNVATTETIYLLSDREVFGSQGYETSGPAYTPFFSDAESRKMYQPGASSASGWWLRSAYSAGGFRLVSGSGGQSGSSADSSYGVVFGFCLGSYLDIHAKADSLSEIRSALADGTYSTKYAKGDLFTLSSDGEGQNYIQVLDFLANDKADNSGKAKMACCLYHIMPTNKRMNPSKTANTEGTGALGGWEKSEIRTYLRETIYPLLPQGLRDMIVPVKKYTRIFQASDETAVNNVETTDTIYLLSDREVFGSQGYETSGPMYSDVFNSAASRKKTKRGSSSASSWWLRSANAADSFRRVSGNGAQSNNYADGSYGVVFGFDLDG